MRFIFQKFIFQLCIIKRKIIFKIISSIRETFTYYFSFSQLYLIVNKTWKNFSTLEKRKGIFCCSVEKFSLLLDSRNLNFNWVGISISKIFPLLPPLLLLATISDYTRGGGEGGKCNVGKKKYLFGRWPLVLLIQIDERLLHSGLSMVKKRRRWWKQTLKFTLLPRWL